MFIKTKNSKVWVLVDQIGQVTSFENYKVEGDSNTCDCYVNQTEILEGKDEESEQKLSFNSPSIHCFCLPRCQTKSHVLESHSNNNGHTLQSSPEARNLFYDWRVLLSTTVLTHETP